MTGTPARVPDDLFHRLSAQLTQEQLVELTAAIALENFSARFNRAFAIEPDGA
jgi:alkylhydroperoxidase family enzyme